MKKMPKCDVRLILGVPGIVAFGVMFSLPGAATRIRDRHSGMIYVDVYQKSAQFHEGVERNAAEKASETEWQIVRRRKGATPFSTLCGQAINCEPATYSEGNSYTVVYRHRATAYGFLGIPEHGATITVLYERHRDGDFCRERMVGGYGRE